MVVCASDGSQWDYCEGKVTREEFGKYTAYREEVPTHIAKLCVATFLDSYRTVCLDHIWQIMWHALLNMDFFLSSTSVNTPLTPVVVIKPTTPCAGSNTVINTVHSYYTVKKEDKSRFIWLLFVPCKRVDLLLARLRCTTTPIRILFVLVWRHLALFLRFQLLYVSIGAAAFPRPFLESAMTL